MFRGPSLASVARSLPTTVGILLAVVAAVPATAQQEARSLAPGESVSGSIEAGGAQEYVVDLDADSWVLARADQATVDVVVTVLDPAGEEVGRFDQSPRGPDVFTFETEAAGRYVLRVTPFEDEEGDYALALLRVEDIADDPEDRVDQIMAPWDLPGTPGVVATVVEGGEPRFTRAYGMADLAWDLPFTEETPSNIGSVTKHFTAMALLLLEQDGKLSLQDDVRDHIPELPDFGTPVTLKHLLNHTGGYREIYNFLPLTGRQGEDLIRRDEAVRIVQRQPELQAEPGTEFNYNNTGYILLATVVERVSGMSFPAFMQERVFEPLGMTHTRVKYAQGEIVPGRALGYVPDEDGGWREARDLGGSAGAGGIYTTAEDMARWFDNWTDGTVGGPAAYQAITTSAILANGDTTGYGLGMGVREMGGLTLYTHTGGDVAHRTWFGYLPELDAGVWVSSNNGTFPTGAGAEVLRAFYGDRMEPEDEESDEDGAGEVTWPEERLEAVAGEWMAEAAGLRLTFEVEDGRLYAEAAGDRRAMIPTSDSTMTPRGAEEWEVTWHFDPDGSVESGTLVQGQAVDLVRLEVDPPTVEALTALEGRYYSEELELIVDVRVDADEEDGEPGLSFVLPTGDTVELEAVSASTFEGPFPYQSVEFERMPNGSASGFTAGNGRTKGVFFRRW